MLYEVITEAERDAHAYLRRLEQVLIDVDTDVRQAAAFGLGLLGLRNNFV